MIKILFMRLGKAYLPEIDAYINYFNSKVGFAAFDSSKIKNINIDDFNVIWEFKGIGGIKINSKQLLIHEYVSLSTGKFKKLKNILKKYLNRVPDLRVYLNEIVKNEMNFKDSVEYCFRDMGINREELIMDEKQKEYDIVYIGSICKEREMDFFLMNFVSKCNLKLCLIGDVEKDILNQYKDYKNITFTGRVEQSKVKEYALKAEYGLNYVPDKYPFNLQTSTKLLEYLSSGLKIISSNYLWVNNFEKSNNLKFLYIDDKFNNLKGEYINKFDFQSKIDLENIYWDRIIENSKIYEKILFLLEKKSIF